MPNPYSLTPLVPHELGRLFVLAFPDEGTAFTLRDTLLKWEEDSIIDVGDMVVVTRDRQGRVRLHQSLPLTAVGSALGSLGGMVFGMMLLNPLFGSIAGAAVGAAAGAMQDIGISDEFMRELGETLTLGTSALFVTVRSSKPQPLLERLQAFAGTCPPKTKCCCGGFWKARRSKHRLAVRRADFSCLAHGLLNFSPVSQRQMEIFCYQFRMR